MIETGKPLTDESYLKWFGWALLSLGRDLEAAHAAAEAACHAETAGQPVAEIQSAARHAGDRPQLDRSVKIAVAEWAFWAQTTLGEEPSACLQAARLAVTELESTHDLETATDRMWAGLASYSAGVGTTSAATGGVAERAIPGRDMAIVTATGGVAETILADEPHQAHRGKLPPKGWLAAIAALLVAWAFFLWVLVISPRVFPPPTLKATVNGSYVAVSIDNYPANQNVYFLIDGVADQSTSTDGSGHANVRLLVTPGLHYIGACLDRSTSSCLAGTQVTR